MSLPARRSNRAAAVTARGPPHPVLLPAQRQELGHSFGFSTRCSRQCGGRDQGGRPYASPYSVMSARSATRARPVVLHVGRPYPALRMAAPTEGRFTGLPVQRIVGPRLTLAQMLRPRLRTPSAVLVGPSRRARVVVRLYAANYRLASPSQPRAGDPAV